MSRLHNLRHQVQGAGAPAYYPLGPGYGAAPPAGPYYPTVLWRKSTDDDAAGSRVGWCSGMYPDQQYQNLQAEEHRDKQHEHRAEMGALGAAVFAAYENVKRKWILRMLRDITWTHKLLSAATLGLAGYALYEHHEAHKMHKAEKHERHHQKHDHHHHH